MCDFKEKVQKQFLWVMVVIVLIVGVIFSIGKDSIQINRQGDAAIFEQITVNISQGKGAVSNVFAETQNFIDKRYVYEPMTNLINRATIPPIEKERDMLRFHAYWLMYLIAPFLYFLNSSLLLTLIQTFSYIGLLLGACYAIKKRSHGYLVPLLFSPFILFSPPWLGGMMGQFYPDRLFVLLGFLLCFSVYFNARAWLLIFMALLVTSLNERAALIGGILLLFIPFCQHKKTTSYQHMLLCLVLGICLILYAYLCKRFFLTNAYYDTFLPSSINDLWGRFFLNGFSYKICDFFIANGLLLAFSFFNFRLGVFSLFLMLPNIVGDIGGAEKVGWLTHYHSYYLPVLIFTAAIGFATFLKKYRPKRGFFLSLIILYAALLIPFVKETSQGRLSSINAIVAPFHSFFNLLKGRATGYQIKQGVIDSVAEGSSVSTNELGMALLSGHSDITIFPVAVARSDYLFLPCDWFEGQRGHLLDNALISKQWLEEHGFNILAVQKITAINYCLFPKTHGL